MKLCKVCGQTLPLIDFSRMTSSRDGLQHQCRACQKRMAAERRARRAAEEGQSGAVLHDDGKRCPRCKQFLPWEAFHRNRSYADGRQSHCRLCATEIRRDYELRNKEVLALRRLERQVRSADAGGFKTCPSCRETKPLVDFYRGRNADGRSSYCRECAKARRRVYVAANAEKIREQNARRTKDQRRRDHRQFWLGLYKLTQDDYAELLRQQEGVCAICLMPERYIDSRTGEPRRLAVDHDHETGLVRGLLCGRCNRGLGQLGDSLENVQRAATYLSAATSKSGHIRGG